jgi:sialic acid synthase SpsE
VPKKILPKVEHQQENLKCVLTQEDLVKLGQTQAAALQEQSKNDDDFRTMQTAYKNKQATLTATIKEVSEKIRNGYEFRFIPVTVTTDYEGNLVSFTRDDTGVLYSQRILNTAEKQFKMDLQADLNPDTEASLKDTFPREGEE